LGFSNVRDEEKRSGRKIKIRASGEGVANVKRRIRRCFHDDCLFESYTYAFPIMVEIDVDLWQRIKLLIAMWDLIESLFYTR